jgi:thymidylate kinase
MLREHPVIHVGIVGAGCSGKTVTTHETARQLRQSGIRVITVDETPTTLIRSAAPDIGRLPEETRIFIQMQMIRLMRRQWSIYHDISERLAVDLEQPVVVLHDLTEHAAVAYFGDGVATDIFAETGDTLDSINASYDLLIYLHSAARVGQYETDSNDARYEDIEVARQIDLAFETAGASHPNVVTVSWQSKQSDKVRAVLAAVQEMLGSDSGPQLSLENSMTTMTEPTHIPSRFSPEEIERLDKQNPNTETCLASYLAGSDGVPITGVVFRCDYDATQEYGLGDLCGAISGKGLRDIQMRPEALRHIVVFEDCTGIAISARPLHDGVDGIPRVPWGTEIYGTPERYAEGWAERLIYVRDLPFRTWWKVAELRQAATDLGIRPLPRTKAGLIEALANHPHTPAKGADVWPANFRYGSTLILRADSGLTERAIRHLVDAADAGTLCFGSASGPFHTGLFLYDGRDETEALQTGREKRWRFIEHHEAILAPVRERLKEKGYSIYFLGKANDRHGAEPDQIVYWLNASRPGRGGHIYGWYTLAQLQAEDWGDGG